VLAGSKSESTFWSSRQIFTILQVNQSYRLGMARKNNVLKDSYAGIG